MPCARKMRILIKGGVWKNSEDEVLKARSVQQFGLLSLQPIVLAFWQNGSEGHAACFQ